MPREIKDLKVFMGMLTEKDNTASTGEKQRPKNSFKKSLTVKRNNKITKFKLRTKKYLVTFKTTDNKVVTKVLNHLPNTLTSTEVKNKKIKKSK